MSSFLFAAALSLAAPAHAGAGVSPFIVAVTPDALPDDIRGDRLFDGVEAVYLMDSATADSVSWRGYVWGPHGEPVIGAVSWEIASTEVLSTLDRSTLTRSMIAVVDDRLVQELVDEALVGSCGREPELRGLVQGDLIDSGVARQLPGLDRGEPAVAVAAYGLDTNGVTDLSARLTGYDDVTLINPDSMLRGGWCEANPTPHP